MTSASHRVAPRFPNPWNGVLAAVLGDLRAGEITIVTPDGREHRFAGKAPGPVAHMVVRDGSTARRVATGGDIGLAESYMDGSWDTPDLDAFLDFATTNLALGWTSDIPLALRPAYRAWQALRDNDPFGGAKRNVAYHYDLGNDFFELWLDDTMTYSAACFEADAAPLAPEHLACAQRRKWDRVLDLIQPSPGDHLLEIGCGWGGFALHAAKEAGCKVTGLTLSEEQAALARERVREQGLEGRIDIRLQDYREVAGTYSGIASIEMFEAVGEKWWPTFFGRVRDLLEPGHAAGLQVITIPDKDFESYRKRSDFIRRYIFPGGMLPSPERFRTVAESAGLTVSEPRFIRDDYARTLAAWGRRFEDVLPDVRGLGFDDRFLRMWRYYLSSCRAGFETGVIDVMQVRLES